MDRRIIQYFDDELTEKERIELLSELENNPVLKEDLLHYQNQRAILSLSPENMDTKAGSEGLRAFARVRRKKNIYLVARAVAGYAALLCVAVVVTWKVARPDREVVRQETAGMQELFVPAGQRARLTLPDGTIAWLNAGSVLQYPSFFEKERKVSLSGEAFFDVAADPDKPFIVSAGGMDIRALGTRFNVYSYPKAEYTNVTLLQGKVKVYNRGAESEGIILEPGQQLFCTNERFDLQAFTDKDYLLWRDGVYSFKKERLDVIVKKLELYYDVDIVVKDSQILKYEYTGKFRQRDGIMEILRIIRKIHNFKIEKDEELNRITISR
ncbi:MAG: FecR domain-containing protein [Tannerella sp.]|jgi:ferric-dicitrate binding protein FerR (iron transport regulator)|nr:FecR domain-containing protein [Tannerella sp.]